MEERIEQNERQIKASVEIEEEFSGDALQHQFKALEKGSTSATVDSQLLALKQQMGMLPAGASPEKRQIGAGQAEEETVNADIEDTRQKKSS